MCRPLRNIGAATSTNAADRASVVVSATAGMSRRSCPMRARSVCASTRPWVSSRMANSSCGSWRWASTSCCRPAASASVGQAAAVSARLPATPTVTAAWRSMNNARWRSVRSHISSSMVSATTSATPNVTWRRSVPNSRRCSLVSAAANVTPSPAQARRLAFACGRATWSRRAWGVGPTGPLQAQRPNRDGRLSQHHLARAADHAGVAVRAGPRAERIGAGRCASCASYWRTITAQAMRAPALPVGWVR